jgi:hypothetical protein
VIAVAGTAAHFLAMNTALVEVVDAGFGLGLFVTLAGWVHVNRVAIMRGAEPDPVLARTKVRIVRPREGRPRRRTRTTRSSGWGRTNASCSRTTSDDPAHPLSPSMVRAVIAETPAPVFIGA